jgi:FixJ family two-component response regulator
VAEAAPLVVYVLDDDAAVRAGLCRFFRAAGLRDRPCATVDELLEGLDSARPACVLFDLSVGHRDGPGLAERLGDRGLQVPLIAVSGRYDVHAGRDARAAGASLLFRKPVDGRALLDAIEWVTAARNP